MNMIGSRVSIRWPIYEGGIGDVKWKLFFLGMGTNYQQEENKHQTYEGEYNYQQSIHV